MVDVEESSPRAVSDPAARIGMVVDKFSLVRVLGRGGMGAVYEARHAMLSRRFAIKFLLPELAANREVLRRFENEAKAAGALEHPNVAAVTDFGRAPDGAPYIVMEFLQGQDCATLLHRTGPLPVRRAVNIVLHACRGLAVAHAAGIVHRDLKPENLFVTDAGDGSDLVKVLDFGIAKLRATDASVITGTGATFGTAFYMSPEQARGAGEVDPRTDVWSLGVVLYELLAGRKPFVGEQFLQVIHQILSVEPPPLASLRRDLPPSLIAAIGKALQKDLTMRTSSVIALGEALAPFAADRSAASSAAPSLGPTMPTPATLAAERVPASSVAAESPVAERPAAARRRTRNIVLLVAAGVAMTAVVFALAAARRQPVAGTAPPRAPQPQIQSAGILPTKAPALVVSRPSPTQAPQLQPAPTVVPVRNVRTLSEQRKVGPPRHPAHSTGKSELPPATAATPSIPAPAQPKPALGHPLQIDKDDPFGP